MLSQDAIRCQKAPLPPLKPRRFQKESGSELLRPDQVCMLQVPITLGINL